MTNDDQRPEVSDEFYELIQFMLTAQDDFKDADWEAYATSNSPAKRRAAAMSYLCPERWLALLCEDELLSVQLASVANRSTPTVCVDPFAQHANPKAKYFVSRHPNASTAALRYLAAHSDESIREGLASNESTPLDILRTLTTDGNREVRFALLYNRGTAADILKRLAMDADDEIRGIASEAITGA